MIKISELKEGDVLKNPHHRDLSVLQHLGKVVILESDKGVTGVYSERELNDNEFELIQPTTEKKYYMGFEVREYPERPIVEV